MVSLIRYSLQISRVLHAHELYHPSILVPAGRIVAHLHLTIASSTVKHFTILQTLHGMLLQIVHFLQFLGVLTVLLAFQLISSFLMVV